MVHEGQRTLVRSDSLDTQSAIVDYTVDRDMQRVEDGDNLMAHADTGHRIDASDGFREEQNFTRAGFG
jgi:hypothetical protein